MRQFHLSHVQKASLCSKQNCKMTRRRNSSGSAVNVQQTRRPKKNRFKKYFSVLQNIQNLDSPSCLPGVDRTDHEAAHSVPFKSRQSRMRGFYFHSAIRLRGLHRENFTPCRWVGGRWSWVVSPRRETRTEVTVSLRKRPL